MSLVSSLLSFLLSLVPRLLSGLGKGGEVDDGPVVEVVSEQPSGEVVFVPAGLDEDDGAVGFEASVEVSLYQSQTRLRNVSLSA